MKKRLVLNINSEVIENAKNFAHENKTNLSSIVEGYLKRLVDTPITASLRGSFSIPSDWNYKEILTEQLGNKYL